MKRVAVFGGSFNPPGEHHYLMLEMLSAHFDEIIVVPCGARPDKPTTNDVHSTYRAAMVDMAFRNILPKIKVDLFDLEEGSFTRTHILQERYQDRGEVWHVVGTDLLEEIEGGKNTIQLKWEHGEKIWKTFKFAVFIRNTNHKVEFPPNCEKYDTYLSGSSSEIRLNAFLRKENDNKYLVNEQVFSYMERYGLYRGAPKRTTALRFKEIRPLVIADPWNKTAVSIANCLSEGEINNPNVIVVIGGDGTMLRAIKSEWRRRIPFYGINLGNRGFLLNGIRDMGRLKDYLGGNLVVEKLPLLWIESDGPDGKQTSLAFNEGWVERSGGQAAWLELHINGTKKISQIIGDGALISTAAGSTAYARALGAYPLPMNTPVIMIVGSNVLKPHSWRPTVLPLNSMVKLTTLDADKRPLRGFIDGVSLGEVYGMKARASNVASVELAFDFHHDAAAKLAGVQFDKL